MFGIKVRKKSIKTDKYLWLKVRRLINMKIKDRIKEVVSFILCFEIVRAADVANDHIALFKKITGTKK